jgi:hypothetical protein
MNILNPNERGEICLRATNARFFNDPYEFNLAVSMLKTSMIRYEKEKSKIEKKSKYFNNSEISSFATIAGYPFLISFSENSDDLTMWRTYGADGNGVAIGFDRKMLIDYTNTSGIVNTRLIKCSYNKNMILKNLIKYWESLYDKISFDNGKTAISSFNVLISIGNICFSIKRKEYKEEKEYRLCKNDRDSNNIKFFEREGLIIPYVELYLPKEIIKKIFIGPCVNPKLTMESLQFYLKSKGYSIKKEFLVKSKAPYRKV